MPFYGAPIHAVGNRNMQFQGIRSTSRLGYRIGEGQTVIHL